MNVWDPVQTLTYAVTSVRPGYGQLKEWDLERQSGDSA